MDVSWPIITVAVSNVATLAVVVANAYYRIRALGDQRRAMLDQFHAQNKQLDRMEATVGNVASVTPVIAAAVGASVEKAP